MKAITNNFTSLFIAILFSITAFAQNAERDAIDAKYKWDNTVVFADLNEWIAAKDNLAKKIELIDDNKGKLAESAENLYATLTVYIDCLKDYYLTYDYAFRVADEDLRISANQEYVQQMDVHLFLIQNN